VLEKIEKVKANFMIGWLNLGVMILSSMLFQIFYVISASPAFYDKIIGNKAYNRSTLYRIIAAIFLTILAGNYIIYYFYPLPIPIAETFPWSWYLSLGLAIILSILAMYLMVKGMIDAGKETMSPKKEHTLYKGIYDKIRHPQALGEYIIFVVIALIIHSPFLLIYSIIVVLPIYYLICLAEEKDLVIRYGDSYIEYRKKTGFFIPKKRRRINE
jgi:protein-S-isoprenylcysteine O-methyltransferase Ste14